MGNCLVTKLKAVVDNPDLPIMETMQQFTLNAIAASGNSTMTDEQKWALNHFFYQIGAIQNSGIYTKLAFIGLPMIAGNIDGALNNYVGNLSYTISDNRIALSDHCIKSSVAGSINIGYNTLPKTLTIKTNISIFAGVKDSSVTTPLIYTKDANNQATNFYINAASEFGIGNIPYTSYSTAKRFTPAAQNMGCVISGQNNYGYYFDAADSTLKKGTMSTLEELLSDPTSNFQLVAPSITVDCGMYYVAFGEALTDSEMNTLAMSLIDLRTAFITE